MIWAILHYMWLIIKRLHRGYSNVGCFLLSKRTSHERSARISVCITVNNETEVFTRFYISNENVEWPTNNVKEILGNSVCYKTMHIRPHCISLPRCVLVAVCVYVCYEDSISQQQKGTLSLHHQCNIPSIELFTFSF